MLVVIMISLLLQMMDKMITKCTNRRSNYYMVKDINHIKLHVHVEWMTTSLPVVSSRK